MSAHRRCDDRPLCGQLRHPACRARRTQANSATLDPDFDQKSGFVRIETGQQRRKLRSYLASSLYLQGGMRLTAVDAGMRMLPVGIGYFLASFAAASILHRLGPRALTLGFAIQMLGLVVAIMAVSGILAGGFGAGLLIAGIGFGISMPSIIKAVISGIDQRHAGLASGIVMSSLQVGGAVGVAMVGGVFFSTLGNGVELSSYAHAFNVSTTCNVVLMALGGALSLRMPALRHAMKGR